MVRLQKFLAQAGVSSRREAERLIAAGAVRVNGVVVDTLGQQVDPERDRVEVNGRRVKVEPPLYRLLLKPRQCLSVIEAPLDEQGRKRPSLHRYVKDPELGWKVVGPLDFPTEGLLLLTTDGELAEMVSKGKSRLTMTYHLKFQGLVGDAEVERLMKGWRWENKPVKPLAVQPLATTGKNTWIEVEVAELRPRALRIAGELIRRRMLKISRVKFGPLTFEGLSMGQWRDLDKKEIARLRGAAGLAPEPAAV